jgi:hypothetical protein
VTLEFLSFLFHPTKTKRIESWPVAWVSFERVEDNRNFWKERWKLVLATIVNHQLQNTCPN